jgi:hypothetical protein
MPTPTAAIAYKKILKTSFGMADLDKADQAGAIAEPIFFDTGQGDVRAWTECLSVFAVVATTLTR